MARLIGEDPSVTRTPERSLTLGLMALAGAVHLGLIFGSDPAALLTTWVPDDAFYYLQPAWNAAAGLGFSFDGVEPTYGFQPLWALVLAAVSTLLPGKAALVPVALLLGGALHLLAGALLFRWFEQADLARGGVVAAAIWLLNPNVMMMQASGMESGLVACLILATLLLLSAPTAGFALGVVLGLLVLARVSMLAFVLLVAGGLLWRRRPARTVLGVGGGLVLVCLPWLIYALVTLGQPLPASMDRKLVSGFAGAGRFLAGLPLVPDGLVRGLLPFSEREFFDLPALVGPTWERLWRLGVRAPVGWALGSWLPARMEVSALVLLAGWTALLVRLRGSSKARLPTGAGLLVALAVINAAANNLLLSQYVEYGFWYRVPEVLCITAAVGVLAARALAPDRPLTRPLQITFGVVLVTALISTASTLRPRSHDPDSTLMTRGALDVARALSERLPAGAKVGSWNAGLIGWMADGPMIVNLDGLANRPDFVPIAAQEVRFRHGLDEGLELLGWLERNGVEYLVDLQPIDVADEPFYGVIPSICVSFVLRSTEVDHWQWRDRAYAVTLVRLLPAGSCTVR